MAEQLSNSACAAAIPDPVAGSERLDLPPPAAPSLKLACEECVEFLASQSLVTELTVENLDGAVLSWTARLHEQDVYTNFHQPLANFAGGIHCHAPARMFIDLYQHPNRRAIANGIGEKVVAPTWY